MAKVVYLKTRDNCPNCGCKEGLVHNAILALKGESKLSPGVFPDGVLMRTPLVEERTYTAVMGNFIVPGIFIYYEVCADCQMMYCRKFDVQYVSLSAPVQTTALKRGN